MKLENPVFKLVQRPAADQAKIRHVLLILAPPGELGLPARDELQRGSAHMLLFGGAMPEPRVAGAEDRSQNAIAGLLAGAADSPHPKTMALGTSLFRQRDCV